MPSLFLWIVSRSERGSSSAPNLGRDATLSQGLSLPSSFIDTRTICKEQRKWLMVNIQVGLRSQIPVALDCFSISMVPGAGTASS